MLCVLPCIGHLRFCNCSIVGSIGVWPTRCQLNKYSCSFLRIGNLRFCNCSIVGSLGVWPTRFKQKKTMELFLLWAICDFVLSPSWAHSAFGPLAFNIKNIVFLLWAICDFVLAPSWAHLSFGPLVCDTKCCCFYLYGEFAMLCLLHRGLTWLLTYSHSIKKSCVLVLFIGHLRFCNCSIVGSLGFWPIQRKQQHLSIDLEWAKSQVSPRWSNCNIANGQ